MALTLSGTTGVAGVDGSAGTPAVQGSDTNTGISFGTDTVSINTGGTARATVDSSGRLLVGTTSARSTGYTSSPAGIQVEGANFATVSVYGNNNGANGGYIELGKFRGGSVGSTTIVNSGDIMGGIQFGGWDGSTMQYGAKIEAYVDGTPGTNDMPGRLVFQTTADGASSPTERMRISNNGSVTLSGPSANAVALAVNSAVAGSSGGNYPLVVITSTGSGDAGAACLHLGKYDNSTSTSNPFIRFYINNAGTGSGQINANGASAAAFGTFSDERLKENISELPSQLQNICALRPVEFDYKDGSGHQIGFIAQEMQTVYPDVIGKADGMLTITGWSKTEARLVKALQEAAAKIESLEARLTTLEGGTN